MGSQEEQSMSTDKELTVITLQGNAINNANCSQLSSLAKLATFTLATYKGGETDGTGLHRIIAWGDLARYAAGKIRKGHRVSVTGRVQPAKSGSDLKSSIMEIVAYQIHVLEENPVGAYR
jgi:single-stranded DNA-binding protein